MTNIPQKPPMSRASTQFRIAVDGTAGYDYQGVVGHPQLDTAWRFDSVLELLDVIRYVLTRYTSLESTHQARTWKKTDAMPERVPEVSEKKMDKGKEATFLLHVQYHQNTTWQGTVEWLESKRKMPFRSTLELIQLIEQVVGAVKPEAEEADETAATED